MTEKTVSLGSEHDDDLRRRLKNVLAALSARKTDSSWGHYGSQMVETLDVIIGGLEFHIETETYMGQTLSGPTELIDRIADIVSD